MNLKKINNPFGGLTYYKESTTSTMSEAMALVLEGGGDGSIFIADYQSEGIGRITGRKWIAQADKNLTFTLVLNKDYIGHGYGLTPLKAGLALSNVIKELTNINASVKWPNDVLVDGKKISGILCRSQKNSILVGVGVNVNQTEFDPSLNNKSTSLSILTNKGFSLEMVLSKFLESFHAILNCENWLQDLNNVLYRVGDEVKFAIGDPKKNNIVQGELVGLDEHGKVMIKDSEGNLKGYLSGEFI